MKTGILFGEGLTPDQLDDVGELVQLLADLEAFIPPMYFHTLRRRVRQVTGEYLSVPAAKARVSIKRAARVVA